jgi:hypothetical protein
MEFKLDPKSGKNPLYNTLNAYCHYDPEINYCQGQGMVMSMLLKVLDNSEEDAFYCFIYIMEKHKWKYCFDDTTSKLVVLLEFFKHIIEGAFTKLYEHLSCEIDEDWLTVAF